MTAEELIALSTKMADETNRVLEQQLQVQLNAGDRLHARGVSKALSEAAVALLKNPTS